ncbi:MAG: 30S ribosomal protein S21 [Bacteroidota bacterium]|nr:30S ribosomal protein S21 [Bacteroidota bacterium]
MIKIPVKEGENIERALKRFKRKYERTGVLKEIRERQAYKKPSLERKEEINKAIYVEGIRREEREG